MGSVFTIAKKDFVSFFTSVRGTIIVAVFLFLTGLFFINFVETFMQMSMQSAGGAGGPALEQLLRALFYNMHFLIILLIPAVTMSTFAEEKRSHTIRILQTAPISSLQIVMGKFLAASGLVFIMITAASVYPIYTIFYGNPDIGPIITGLVGLLLLTMSHVAFGLWISSMTRSQLLALLFTFGGLFLLLILNWFAGNISGNGWLENAFKYLATTPHLDVLLKGMVTVSDVGYFACFTALFLFFTNVVIDSLRWR